MNIKTREAVITALKPLIDNDPEVELCILYGSAALDNLSERSDIDIAVGSEIGLSNDHCIELSQKMSLVTNREVSIIDIEKMEGIILQEVLVKGITLKNSNTNYKAVHISKMYDFTEDILPFQMMGINKKVRDFLNE